MHIGHVNYTTDDEHIISKYVLDYLLDHLF